MLWNSRRASDMTEWALLITSLRKLQQEWMRLSFWFQTMHIKLSHLDLQCLYNRDKQTGFPCNYLTLMNLVNARENRQSKHIKYVEWINKKWLAFGLRGKDYHQRRKRLASMLEKEMVTYMSHAFPCFTNSPGELDFAYCVLQKQVSFEKIFKANMLGWRDNTA